MVAMSRKNPSNWPAVIAAMLYLAVFFATCYGLYVLAGDGSFVDAFATAFPRVLGIAALFYVTGLVRDVYRRQKSSMDAHAPLSDRIEQSIELTHR